MQRKPEAVPGFIVVDMQQAAVDSADGSHDLADVVSRINALATRVRTAGGHIVFVQHDGEHGSDYEPDTTGWAIASCMDVQPEDLVIRKKFNDAFHETSLDTTLRGRGVSELIVAGWATDFCVDATVRSAAARGYRVTVAQDCHTTIKDRPHLYMSGVVAHHNWVWVNLIAPGGIVVQPAAEIGWRIDG